MRASLEAARRRSAALAPQPSKERVMRDRPTGGQSQAGEAIAPSKCPACRSSDITTTSKIVTAQAYWRCVACGEVWNVRRRGATRQFDPFRR
jgi:hypothetical protein